MTAYIWGMDDMWYWVAVVPLLVGLVSVLLGLVVGFASGQTPLLIGFMGGVLAGVVSMTVLVTRWVLTGVAMFETEHVALAASVWHVVSWCLVVMLLGAGLGIGFMVSGERHEGRASTWRMVLGSVVLVVGWLGLLVLVGAFVVEWVLSGSLF